MGLLPSGNQTWQRTISHLYLVGGLEHFLFSPIVGMMIQSDFHIFQGGRSTTNQISIYMGMDQYLLIPFLGG